MAFVTTPSSLSSTPLLRHRHRRPLPAARPISAVHATDPPPLSSSSAAAAKWNIESWKTKNALQLSEYPDPDALGSVLRTLESFPPVVFVGEARSLEERLGQAAMGDAFLLQGGDCAESFKEFNVNNIRDTFRVILQMSVVLMFGGQMPVIKVWFGSR
ncbi:phospho-2-dehydro-3-deoxyheptonate aldolase 2, chloroplastic-like [Eucalyptus grandis]|uniref:phospho-2-dehydro-3-deoxyheptonate aldolase 2, chloroplastic-like n=1 Tax=Eucalyptus grandis TaxID=71139 RepID=UPI00192EFC70|nr:phospho-2-dehydro-3-deoxyheptonate aldolase 2, chloroplastic-like [Eucalyptus grandis]